MGCGASKKSAGSVIGNTVTQNGSANPKSAKNANGNVSKNGGISNEDRELEEAATRIQATYRGYTTRKQIKMSNNQEEEVDIDLNDPEVSKATQKIQASFRGHQVRRQQEKAKAEADLAEKMEKLKTKEAKAEEEEELPDLSDPDLHKAATKIQAQFKGHMVRKTKEGSSPSK